MLINFQLIIFLSLIKIIAMEKLAKFCLLLTSFRLKQIYSDKKNARKINRCWFLFTIKLISTFYYLIKIKVLHHHVLVVMISSSGLWRYQLVDDDSIIFSIEICDNSALPFPINFLFYFIFIDELIPSIKTALIENYVLPVSWQLKILPSRYPPECLFIQS